jgi:perosamine synthetase
MDEKFIPVCTPTLSGNELKYIEDAVKSTWISSRGKYLDEFEKKFAQFTGTSYAVSTTNGTAALHLALKALGIKKGDEVILPTFTMISTAFAVCYCQALPVFVDCQRDTWNIDVEKIEEKITPRTKAIMVVHIYGHPCDMDPIIEIAKKYGLLIIEDAAEAHGAEYKGKKCGAFGDAACFSFYANKIISTGEGGMVLTNDPFIYEKLQYFKNLAFPLNAPRLYEHNDIGFNYRMSNLHAAIGLAQLENIDTYINARRRNAQLYNRKLSEVAGITAPVEKKGAKNVYWMYSILVEDDFRLSRDELMQKLLMEKIDSRPFFVPMHKQKSLREYGCNCSGNYPVADEISRKGLYLPSSSSLTEEEIGYICDMLKSQTSIRIAG